MLRTKGLQVIPDGDRLVLELPGGAGMGDPAARDPALVARDVRDGLVSAENARALYKVARAGNGGVDQPPTQALRSRRLTVVAAKPLTPFLRRERSSREATRGRG